MATNIGTIDRALRIVIGVHADAYALKLGLPAPAGIGLAGSASCLCSPPLSALARFIACWREYLFARNRPPNPTNKTPRTGASRHGIRAKREERMTRSLYWAPASAAVPMAFELKELLGKKADITVVSLTDYFQFVPSNPWSPSIGASRAT